MSCRVAKTAGGMPRVRHLGVMLTAWHDPGDIGTALSFLVATCVRLGRGSILAVTMQMAAYEPPAAAGSEAKRPDSAVRVDVGTAATKTTDTAKDAGVDYASAAGAAIMIAAAIATAAAVAAATIVAAVATAARTPKVA